MSINAWVFAGGEFKPDSFNIDWVVDGDIVLGVDRGIAHCLSTGLVPDILMGDFDSVDPALLDDTRLINAQRHSFPTRKNSSDLDLALQWLCNRSVSRVTVLAVSGGRSDHHLFNWLLPMQRCWPFNLEMIDASVHAYLATAQFPFNASVVAQQVISLVPLPCATGVRTQGLEYPLHDAELDAGTTHGLSNVAIDTSISVTVQSGRLFVFCVRSDTMRTG